MYWLAILSPTLPTSRSFERLNQTWTYIRSFSCLHRHDWIFLKETTQTLQQKKTFTSTNK